MTSELEFNLALTERESEGKTMKMHALISILYQSTNDSRDRDSLRAERSGVRNSGEGEILQNHPDWPRGPPILLYNGCLLSFSVVKGPGRDAELPPLSRAAIECG
jgi:hypothetical protein